jgi:protein-disulfide isomerase
MRRYLPFLLVGLVALLTVASATMLYRAKRPAILTIPESRQAERSKEVHTRGPANAVITLEEFGDFECPPCGILSLPLDQMVHDFQPHMRLIFRHFPLPMHQHAMPAALAAEAAGMQGRFWEMHDLLYKEQPVWSKTADAPELFNSYASVLGLNIERFKKDVANPETAARIKRDQQEGTDLGVRNTPTIFLNGKEVPPSSLSPDSLRKMVDEAIKAKPPSP